MAPFGAKTGPFGGPGGPEEARYQVKVSGNHDSSPVRPIGGSWDQIWTLRALQVTLGPSKGPFGAKTGPFGGPGGPEEARYQVKVCVSHDSSSVTPIGGSWDRIRSPYSLHFERPFSTCFDNAPPTKCSNAQCWQRTTLPRLAASHQFALGYTNQRKHIFHTIFTCWN